MNPQTVHRIKHFLEFFFRIPNEKWATNQLNRGERSCALGHLGVLNESHLNKEGLELCELLYPVARSHGYVTHNNCYDSGCVTTINDTDSAVRPEPRDRILWALNERLQMEVQYEITGTDTSDQTLP